MQSPCKFYRNVLYLCCNESLTTDNALIYMRARYYSPDMRRFINADVVAGSISNAITLNRFAYANGNPVSMSDPIGEGTEEFFYFSDKPKRIEYLEPDFDFSIEAGVSVYCFVGATATVGFDVGAFIEYYFGKDFS